MNLKVVLSLFLIFFASAIITVAMAVNIPTLNDFSVTKTSLHNIESGEVEPAGDPIDDPVFGS